MSVEVSSTDPLPRGNPGSIQLRYPLGPLLVAAETPTHVGLARRVGCARRTVQRWSVGGVPPVSAEVACRRLGVEAADVWPQLGIFSAMEQAS